MAAAIGALAARRGQRVLLAEVQGKDYLSQLFGVGSLEPAPRKLRDNLYGMRVDAEEALEQYLEVKFHMKRIARPFVSSTLVDYVTHAAPGLHDILILGKVWYMATRQRDFDLVVLDAPASGHAVSMLRSPEGFLNAVPVGPLANHARQLLAFLQDPQQVSINLAALPEEMPINETIETTQLLEEQLSMNVDHVLVNMVLEPVRLIENLNGPDQLRGPDADELFRCAEFYRARRSLQEAHLRTFRTKLSRTAQIVRIPYLFRSRITAADIDLLADAIERQMQP